MTVSASAPEPAKSTGSCAAACTASLWKTIPWECATSASSAIGSTEPTSLFTHMTLTSATRPGSGLDGGAEGLGPEHALARPRPARQASAPSWRLSQPTESSTA